MRRRLTIGARLSVFTVSLVIATSLTLAVVVVLDVKQTAYHELLDRGNSLSLMVARNCEYGLYTENPAALQPLLDALISDESVAYTAIRAADGKVIAQQPAREGPPMPPPSTHRDWQAIRAPQTTRLPANSPALFDVVVPVFSEPVPVSDAVVLENHEPSRQLLGVVQVGLTDRQVRARLQTFVMFTVIVTAVILCVAVFLSIVITSRILRPIQKLRDASLEIANGIFDHELTLHGEDIADTTAAFNLMRRRLRQITSELEERAEEAVRTNETLRHEIGERQQAEAALRSSEQRYALAAAGANDGLWDWDLRAQVLYLSPRWSAMLGYSAEHIGSDPREWIDRIHPEDRTRVLAEIDAHMRGETTNLESEHRLSAADGSWRWMLARGLAVRDEQGLALRMAGSQTDITSRRETQERLAHEAFHDALTGLPNRALFLERLTRTMVRSRRRQRQDFAVIFIDLNRFKLVNDSFGHLIGDQLLVNAGKRIRDCVRESDTVARFGGDEFAVLLEDLRRPEEAAHIATKVCREIDRRFELEGYEISSSASCGVAVGSPSYKHPNDLLRDADTAMYRAKFEKRDVVFFDDRMHADAIERLWMETELRRAVEQKQFYLVYQPIFEAATGTIAGVEALLRWTHPRRGEIPPSDFIPIAEDTGLIVELGQSVLQMACSQWRHWRETGVLGGSTWFTVNLSAREFTQPSIVDAISSAVANSGLPTDLVRLEVTETVFVNSASASSLLRRLKEAGFRIFLDDFGSGYSSLSYLHDLPLDVVKIDRLFITALSDENRGDEIVRAIIDIAHHLHMEVIAEGVECEAQAAILRSLGCDYLQGFHLAVPARAEELERTFLAPQRTGPSIPPPARSVDFGNIMT